MLASDEYSAIGRELALFLRRWVRVLEPLGDPAGDAGSPPVDDLYAYDGGQPPADGTDAWGNLAGSEDPATSSLARFWSPGT